jgi:non-ribosomal peptide synthetase component F/aryl carrier-like protein
MPIRSVDRLFEILSSHGSATALAGPHLNVSYSDLTRLVDGVSGKLGRLGISLPGRPILIQSLRGRPSTVVLLLAAWRNEMVPLLLDDQAPRPRVERALRIAQPVAVLRHTPKGSKDVFWSALGDEWELSAGDRGERGASGGCPDPAYIAMTSGSTADPRFVLCRWTGLDIVAPQWAERADIDSSSRLMQISSPAYDAIYTEVVPTLSAGGALVFGSAGLWSRPSRLADFMRQADVTHLTVPPSYLSRILASGRMPCIKTLSAAGEKFDRELAIQAKGYATKVLNAYGPAEATVCALTHDVTGGEDQIPLGRPLAGVSADIDDGIIRITGRTVAWGYLGDGGDVERFETADGPSYLTGDLGEIRDGAFYFLGRADRQVKVHGHRVDLSAVEIQVRSIAGVTNCAVFYSRDQLSCLITTSRALDDVAKEVHELIPAAEWPARWAKVARIHYLDSDKLDLSAANEELDSLEIQGKIPYGPGTEIPAFLMNAWQQHAMLISEDTDFFTSGGDSLSAMQLLEAIYDETGIDIDLADFLTEPTLLNLADTIHSTSR